MRFFLDSPDRAGSGCIPSGQTAAQARSNGWGGMSLGQNSNFNNPGSSINFQIYMYGYANGTHVVEFNNSSAMNAAIYAPTSELIWKNTAGVTGRCRGEQGGIQELRDLRVGRNYQQRLQPRGPADRHGVRLLPDGVDRVPPYPHDDVRPRVGLRVALRALA